MYDFGCLHLMTGVCKKKQSQMQVPINSSIPNYWNCHTSFILLSKPKLANQRMEIYITLEYIIVLPHSRLKTRHALCSLLRQIKTLNETHTLSWQQ